MCILSFLLRMLRATLLFDRRRKSMGSHGILSNVKLANASYLCLEFLSWFVNNFNRLINSQRDIELLTT